MISHVARSRLSAWPLSITLALALCFTAPPLAAQQPMGQFGISKLDQKVAGGGTLRGEVTIINTTTADIMLTGYSVYVMDGRTKSRGTKAYSFTSQKIQPGKPVVMKFDVPINKGPPVGRAEVTADLRAYQAVGGNQRQINLVTITPRQVEITGGKEEGFLAALSALFDSFLKAIESFFRWLF